MAEKQGIYKCSICGNVVEVFHAGDAPEAVFVVSADSVTAGAYCNLHGVWKS